MDGAGVSGGEDEDADAGSDEAGTEGGADPSAYENLSSMDDSFSSVHNCAESCDAVWHGIGQGDFPGEGIREITADYYVALIDCGEQRADDDRDH